MLPETRQPDFSSCHDDRTRKTAKIIQIQIINRRNAEWFPGIENDRKYLPDFDHRLNNQLLQPNALCVRSSNTEHD